MSETVKETHTEIYSTATKAGIAASSIQLSLAARDALNHQAGYLLGGVRVWQTWNAASTATSGGIWRYYTYRHPNVDHALWMIKVVATAKTDATIEVQSGAGAAISETIRAGNDAASWTEWVILRSAYAGGDSGFVPLTVDLTDCAIRSMTVIDMARSTLDAGENLIESYDTTYPRIGLREEEVIGESATAGVKGAISEISDGWDNFHRAYLTYAVPSTNPIDFTGAAWASPVLDYGGTAVVWYTQARQKRTTDTVTESRLYAYTTVPAGTTYQIRITSSNPGSSSDTVTSAALTNADDGWQSLTSLDVDCTTTTTITFEMIRTAGSGTIHFHGLCLLEG